MRQREIDPLAAALQPPPDESPDARALRLAREADARRVSQAIDDAIRAERQANKKKKIVRVLLLGQSESGKSTTLRQFQRLYTPTAFREDRVHWRAIIQLNLLRSIHTILNALAASPAPSVRSRVNSHRSHGARTIDSAWDDRTSFSTSRSTRAPSSAQLPVPPLPHPSPSSPYRHHPAAGPSDAGPSRQPAYHPPTASADMDVIGEEPLSDADNFYVSDPERAPSHPRSPSRPTPKRTGKAPAQPSPRGRSNGHGHHGHGQPNGSDGHLFPDDADDADADADDVDDLRARLFPLQQAEALLKAKLVPPNEDEAVDLGHRPASASSPSSTPPLLTALEVFVRPGKWRLGLGRGRPASAPGGKGMDVDECQRVIWEMRAEIMGLWASRRVRNVLAAKRVRLEEESGFFLDDLERLTQLNYVPTDEDVLKARLKTIGVSEHKFEMEAGDQRGAEWRIVDVGGSRFQRPTWVPFFDDVDAIIFLAPISAFDQVLSEDSKVNRLEDSVLLWRAACSNKLLAHVDLVLFLNKCDILQRKLEAGVRLARYVKSYGDRPNEIESASKYFLSKFSAIQRAYSPVPRKFYGFCTSVTDSATTAGILASVRDIVLRQNLRHVKLT